MKRFLVEVAIIFLIVFLPGIVFGILATVQARLKLGAEYCWVVPNPNPKREWGLIDDMTLSTDWREPFVFWRRVLFQGTEVPWFGAVPTSAGPKHKTTAMYWGWSYRRATYYSLEERTGAFGIFWFPEKCAERLDGL